MSNMVMAARVHAARDIEVELTDVVQIVEVVETALDRFGNRYRFGVCQRAEVAAGTAHDVRQQSDVRRRNAERLQLGPQREEVRLTHVREDQILLMRHAELAETVM